MSTMTYANAVKEAMSIRMREDERVFLMGEDVGGPLGGGLGVSIGMSDEFGTERVRDTPISERAFVGAAVGAAATGMRPIAEVMFGDFVTVVMDELCNQAAKMRYMFGGKVSVPMVVRLPNGAGLRAGAQHSQSLEAWLTHVPGLKVVAPSNAQDALGLMLSAIDDDNPVMYLEHKVLLFSEGEVTDYAPIPLGKGKIVREGKDATIVAWGSMVWTALEAAETLAAEGIEVEIIDPRSLYPFDWEIVENSLKKTNRILFASEENKRGAYTGELAAITAEKYFDLLDAPVARVGSLNCPIPFSGALENYVLPNATDVVNAVKTLL